MDAEACVRSVKCNAILSSVVLYISYLNIKYNIYMQVYSLTVRIVPAAASLGKEGFFSRTGTAMSTRALKERNRIGRVLPTIGAADWLRGRLCVRAVQWASSCRPSLRLFSRRRIFKPKTLRYRQTTWFTCLVDLWIICSLRGSRIPRLLL